jgi:hypothetical protein
MSLGAPEGIPSPPPYLYTVDDFKTWFSIAENNGQIAAAGSDEWRTALSVFVLHRLRCDVTEGTLAVLRKALEYAEVEVGAATSQQQR